mgnify:CR=1 FL=1
MTSGYKENALINGEYVDVVVGEVKKLKGNSGYNVATDRYEDLVKAGVVDPVKVTRSALQNAASAAAMLLTTEVAIADLPEKKNLATAGPGMGMPEEY